MGYNVLKLPKNQAYVKEKARAGAPYAPLLRGGRMNHIFVYICYHFVAKYTKLAYK
jgi:hypothetical protein